MIKIILAAIILPFLLEPAPATAGQRVLQVDPKNVIRLYDMPCVHAGTLGRIRPEFRERFKKAEVTEHGQRVYACWIDEGDGDFYVMFEDGRGGSIPSSSFKDEPGT